MTYIGRKYPLRVAIKIAGYKNI